MKNIYTQKACSFLRWAGSKRQIVPVLSEYWKPHYLRYIEPFAGSASLFFYLAPKKAILGDINSELIDTFREIKNNLEKVLEYLSLLQNEESEYLRLRTLDPNTLTPSSRAARFIFLNRFCFNGLYRTNQKGAFNVPFSGSKTGKIPSREHFAACSYKLRNTKLRCASFEKTLDEAQVGDFVYMDPPFSIKGRKIFNEYNANAFNENSITRLRSCMCVLDKKSIPFVVSYADSDEAKYLAKGFNVKTIIVKRNIAGFSSKRKIDKELLIFN